MSWFCGLVLVSLCAIGSGRSVLQPSGNCHDFRTVVSLIKQCAPSIPSRKSMGVQDELRPSHLLTLNRIPCNTIPTMDTCLTRNLAHCDNREFIEEYVNQTRPLCDGTHLVGWFEDALASLPPIPLDCVREIFHAGAELCAAQTISPFFEGGLEEGILHSETFLDNALSCVLNNTAESVLKLTHSCEGVDMHRAIFAALMLVNVVETQYAILQFRAKHIQQIRETLLPFDDLE